MPRPLSPVRAPTPQQLRILRLLAAGMKLRDPERKGGRYLLQLNKATAGLVQARTIGAMLSAGWILEGVGGEWALTPQGRAHAEVHTFVRHFAEELAS